MWLASIHFNPISCVNSNSVYDKEAVFPQCHQVQSLLLTQYPLSLALPVRITAFPCLIKTQGTCWCNFQSLTGAHIFNWIGALGLKIAKIYLLPFQAYISYLFVHFPISSLKNQSDFAFKLVSIFMAEPVHEDKGKMRRDVNANISEFLELRIRFLWRWIPQGKRPTWFCVVSFCSFVLFLLTNGIVFIIAVVTRYWVNKNKYF